MALILEGDLPAVSLLAALDVLTHLLNIKSQRLNLLHLNIRSNQFNHPMNYLALAFMMVTLGLALPQPTYTIHYVRNYRRDQIESNFGCGKAVVYGTYLHPLGVVDALYALSSGHIYGFNANCQRKDTYVKLFGEAQDFQKLTQQTPNVIEQIANTIGRLPTRKVIIDWKYLPEEGKREEARKVLQDIAVGLQQKAFTVFVKAPASYFCLDVAGKKYILDLPIPNLIAELYGEEPGKYITFDSVFGDGEQTSETGYSKTCPKYPTQPQMSASSSGKRIYFQKTLDSSLSGYIGTAAWQKMLQLAGESKHNSLYFYDGYPLQTVDF